MRTITYINYAQPIIVAPAPIVVTSSATAPSTAATGTPTLANPLAPQVARVENGPANNTSASDSAPAYPNDEIARANEAPSPQDRALDTFETARKLFKRGDFKMALTETDRALAQMPNDPLIHEFRALCLFAMKDYSQSAAAMYAVLSVGPGWDRETLEGLYNNMAVYQSQLNALEAYRDSNPNAGNAHFLLAYHYMLNGRNDQAISELQTVIKLEPRDRLAAQLLKGLSAPDEAPEGPELPEPTVATIPISAGNLPGTWKAQRADGAEIQLTLDADHKFVWNVADAEKPQKLTGTYTFADNYLILSSPGQSDLIGQVSQEPDNKMRFKLAGGSPDDPGLLFSR